EPAHPDAAVDRVRPLRAAPLVTVAAGLRDVTPGDEQAGPWKMTLLQHHAEAVVGAASVTDGREALHEALFGALHGPRRDVGRRVVAMLVGDVLGHRADVHVRV